jgi:hypothetical protein
LKAAGGCDVLCGGTGGGGTPELTGLGLTQTGEAISGFLCAGSESTDRVTDSGVSALLLRTPFDLSFLASSLLIRMVRRFCESPSLLVTEAFFYKSSKRASLGRALQVPEKKRVLI